MADPALTSLETSRNLNVDLLVTYLLNPWTAVYAGYNTNRSSSALTPTGDGPVLAPQPGLSGESWQLFLKCALDSGLDTLPLPERLGGVVGPLAPADAPSEERARVSSPGSGSSPS